LRPSNPSLPRILDRIAIRKRPGDLGPAHLRTGRRGEEDAYFYLGRCGYIMIARNFRTARHHGEIDLIGWNQDVLCFIEVKTAHHSQREARRRCGGPQEAPRHSQS
jgi:hypothetical protein